MVEGAATDCPTDEWKTGVPHGGWPHLIPNQNLYSCDDAVEMACMGVRGDASSLTEDLKTEVELNADQYRESGIDFVCNVSTGLPKTKNCIQLAYTHQTSENNCDYRNPCNRPCTRG